MNKFIIIAVLVVVSIFILYKFYIGKFPTDYHRNAFFVDVRTAQEFAGGTVPNAINIPLDSVPTNLSKFQGHDQVVVFCRSGGRSGKAKAILEKQGIENVVNGGPWTTVAKNIAK